ncbi:MAG: MerR family transcriptional regulator [Crocinitomicaceae bacterium]|nr:MerR family transcriptional regulator [Crocinitomicaceae bacterium]
MEGLKQEIGRIRRLTDLLYNEHFELSDIGLTAKTAFDWTKAGIYLRERKSKFRRKYNGLEYVWLKLVMELRDFGLSIAAILRLKSFLLDEMDLVEFYESLKEEGEDFDEFEKFTKAFKGEIEKVNDVVALDEGKEVSLVNTILSALVSSTIFGRSNTHLGITKSGDCFVFDENPSKDLFVSDHVVNEPYISFPLNYVVKNFIWSEDLYDLKEENEVDQISKDERKIIDLVREGGISSLYIKFINGSVSLMETEEIIDVKETKGKLVDLIRRGSYQEISCKTENGKIVSVKRKTKHK